MSTRLSQTPQEKVGSLTRDEVQCPICWSVLMEPVTLPCAHNLCLECYRNTVKEGCLCCPCCRMRISNWSRRAEKQGGLVNQIFWKKIQDQFPRFVEARLLGNDSQDILDDMENGSSENGVCLSVEVTTDGAKKKNVVVDGATPGKIRAELHELYKQHEDDAETQKKLDNIANVDLIRKLKAEDGFATQQFIFEESCDESTDTSHSLDSCKKSTHDEEKSPQKNGQSKSLCRNLFSEWETGSSGEATKTPAKVSVSGTKLLKPGARRSSWHVASTSGRKKINWKDTAASALETSSQESCVQDGTLCSTTTVPTVNVSPSKSTSILDASKKNVVSSFVPVYSPRMAATELPKPVNGTRLSLDSRTSEVKAKVDHSKRSHVHPSSDTPDSINIEVNSYFRPIRSAPKTPPKQLPDGSYLPEPRLVKSTPIRLGSAPPALMSLPSFLPPNSNPKKSANKKLKLVDYDEDSSNDSNAIPSSTNTVRIFSPPPPILVHYALQGISPNEYLACNPENMEGGRRTGPPPELEVYGNLDDNGEVSKERKMSDMMYRKVQAFQLEQFRKRKMQEDKDRKYAEKLQRELNRANASLRTRDSTERYSIRNWAGSPPAQPSSSDSLPSTNVPAKKYKLRTTRSSTVSDTSQASSVKNGNNKGLTINKSKSTKSRIEPVRQSTRVTRSQSKRGRK
ncbi:unnamed protein product [Allacma fusca]|uniref:RING-type E3 ubiquitin transferase n=1 Tax=Allacma fusca TaxID=39272 RepID=A0A8J2PX71_9HEXA|nr:unnamed protein product [Allacma fusca]